MAMKRLCDLCGKVIEDLSKGLEIYIAPMRERETGAPYFFAKDSWSKDVCLICAGKLSSALNIVPLLNEARNTTG